MGELEKNSKADAAEALMEEGFGCAQSVFAAFADDIGLEREIALRIAGPFGGGIGGLGRTCGALTGGAMVIGFVYGHSHAQDAAKKLESNARVRELLEMVEDRVGTTLCREILEGHDISDPEQREAARQKGLFETGCRRTVRDSAEVLEQLLAR